MSHIRWENLMETERRQFEGMNESERFIYFLLLQYGSPYGWGNENPGASDCSGAVCMALYAATGLLIRTTADDLLRRIFTVANPRAGDIRAVFCLTENGRSHGDRLVAAGTATHIAGFVDDGVILNSQQPAARLRRVSDVSDWYLRNGHEVVVRGLDRAALERLANAGAVWGLDAEFHRYFNVGGADAGGNDAGIVAGDADGGNYGQGESGAVALPGLTGGRGICPNCPNIRTGGGGMGIGMGIKTALVNSITPNGINRENLKAEVMRMAVRAVARIVKRKIKGRGNIR